MPELPEVEIVKQSLKKTINLRKIKNIVIYNRNLRFKIDQKFETKITSKKITNIFRVAKYLIIELEIKNFFLIHFGMSGTLHLVKNKKQKRTNLSFYSSDTITNKHNHFEIFFEDFKIVYNDPRRFGFIKYFQYYDELKSFLKRNGLEPLDRKFNFKYLQNKIKYRNKNIKNILLDQTIISGIGNIYANEILFYSKINPNKLGCDINTEELKKLSINSKKVLKKAILKGGSSIRNFKNSDGNKGNYQKEFKVYNKENITCPNFNCDGKIKKIVISNRSSFFCENCQR